MVAVLALAALAAAQPPDLPPAVRQFGQTMNFYYKAPDPSLGPKLLHEMLRKENVEHPWFDQRADVVNIFGAMLGDVAAGKPKIVRAYEAEYVGASPRGRHLIARALENCGDAATLKQIDAWL